MKIAFLSAYSGIVDRGVETYVHELASRLSGQHQVYVMGAKPPTLKSKYDFIACSLPSPSSLETHPSRSLTHYLFLDSQSRYVRKFSSWATRELIRLKPDIMIPVNNGWQTLLTRLVATQLGSKIVVSSQSGLGRFGPGFDEWANTLMGIDTYVNLTEVARNRLKIFAPWQKTIVIPNGVDLKQFNPRVKPVPLQIPQPVILSVSAIEPSKRIELIVNAVSLLDPPASLLIMGDGPANYKANIQLLAARLLPSRFLIQSARHENMPPIYRAAHVFTLASESSEAFGISIIEAMASGRPVVVTDDPQRREIVGEAGELVNPLDTQLYAKVLGKALKDRPDSRYRMQASKFSWDKVAAEYNRLFSSLIR